jgi:HK97 family phage portal protein
MAKIFGFEITKARQAEQRIEEAKELIRSEMQAQLSGIFLNSNLPQVLVPNFTKGKPGSQVYATNSDLYSIVRLIDKTAAMVQLWSYVKKDEKEYQKYADMRNKKDYTPEGMYNLKRQQEKALEIAGDNDELQMKLDRPNETQSRQEYYEAVYGNRLISGNSFIYTPRLDLGANAGKIQGFYPMPTEYTFIIASQGFPAFVLGYEMLMNGVKLLETTEVLHMRYWNPRFNTSGSQLYGLSPVEVALKITERSSAAKDASVAQYQNGGPSWILSNKDISADNSSVSQITKVKERHEKEYAGPENRGKGMFMSGDTQFHQTGISPVDLNQIEGEKLTMDQLCNIYGVDSVLLNNHEAGTDNNVGHMIKRLYTNAVLPEVYAYRDLLNTHVAPTFSTKGRKLVVDCDITGISELQPDMKTTAEWLAASWWISPNEKREVQKFEKRTEPEMDEPWVPNTYAPLSQATIVVDPLVTDPNNPQP